MCPGKPHPSKSRGLHWTPGDAPRGAQGICAFRWGRMDIIIVTGLQGNVDETKRIEWTGSMAWPPTETTFSYQRSVLEIRFKILIAGLPWWRSG